SSQETVERLRARRESRKRLEKRCPRYFPRGLPCAHGPFRFGQINSAPPHCRHGSAKQRRGARSGAEPCLTEQSRARALAKRPYWIHFPVFQPHSGSDCPGKCRVTSETDNTECQR